MAQVQAHFRIIRYQNIIIGTVVENEGCSFAITISFGCGVCCAYTTVYKSSYTPTCICGSVVAGESVPSPAIFGCIVLVHLHRPQHCHKYPLGYENLVNCRVGSRIC